MEARLRRLAVVIVQHPTKTLTTLDLTVTLANLFTWLDQLVSKPLMIARDMIMVEISAHRLTKGLLAEEDQSRKALRFDAQVKAF